MGAETFSIIATGKTAAEAFRSAQEQARYDHGHSGYTGTIAEKWDFIVLPTPATFKGDHAPRYKDWDHDDPDWQRVDDKWGPAGCYDLGDGRFLFFGWASS